MSSSLIWIISGSLVGIYLIYMLISISRRNNKNQKQWEGRIDSLSGQPKVPKSGKSAKALIREEARSGPKRKGRMSSKIVKVQSLRHWLKYTGYEITPGMLYTAGLLLALLFTGVIAFGLGYHFLIAILVSILLSVIICFAAIQFLIGRQKTLFLNAFPDALDLIRRALRAGYAADRSIIMAAEESPEPVKSAFQEVIDRLSIGEPLEEALGDVANNVGVDEFHLLAIVLVLQRDTGGSLADVVENFSAIMRERLRLRKKVKAITAEGKASGYLVSAIPFGIIAILMVLSPKYLQPLFDTDQGNNFLMLGGGLMATGIFIIYRMVNKDFY